MLVTGVEWRGGRIAMVTVEVAKRLVRVVEAGIVAESDAKDIACGDRIVAVAPAEPCYHTTVPVPAGVALPDVQNYAEIVSLGSYRPGGERQAVCGRHHGSHTDVGIVNLDLLGAHAAELSKILGVTVDASIERTMAWHSLARYRGIELPHVLFDTWEAPANVIIYGDGKEPLASQIESIPGATVNARLQGVMTNVRPLVGPKKLKSLGMIGGEKNDFTTATAMFAPLGMTVEPLWNEPERPWRAALGAILVALAPTHRFTTVSIGY